jgi:hypothetical protein
MNRSFATVLTLPVPRRPEVSQSSTTSRSDIGTSAMIGYGSPSGGTRIAMISCHCAWWAPLMKPHLPFTMTPPSTGVAMPDGLSVPQTRTSSVANTSSCTASGNWQAIQVGIQYTDATHEVEPQPCPSAAPTSARVRLSTSYPP